MKKMYSRSGISIKSRSKRRGSRGEALKARMKFDPAPSLSPRHRLRLPRPSKLICRERKAKKERTRKCRDARTVKRDSSFSKMNKRFSLLLLLSSLLRWENETRPRKWNPFPMARTTFWKSCSQLGYENGGFFRYLFSFVI